MPLEAEDLEPLIEMIEKRSIMQTNAIKQLSNTIFEVFTGKPLAVYPEFEVDADEEDIPPADFADREADLRPLQERSIIIANIMKQLNNTLFEVYTGKATAVFPDFEVGAKPEERDDGTPADFADREADLLPLQERIKKTTQLFTGILTGLYDEDEIQEKLEAMDIDLIPSVEEALKPLTENASFLKTQIMRSSNYTLEENTKHNTASAAAEIERAIKGLVISFVHSDLKADILSSEMRKEPFPETVHSAYWPSLKRAYAKMAGDFARTINDFDPGAEDDHLHGDFEISPD